MSKKKVSRNKAFHVRDLEVLCVIIIVALVGVVAYYAPIMNTKNAEISRQNAQINNLKANVTQLNSQITKLNSQIVNLNNQITNLNDTINCFQSTDIITALNATDILGNSTIPNYLLITGTVKYEGESSAYNAGLHIIGLSATGTPLINMTIPIISATSQDPTVYQNAFITGISLSTLYPTQSVSIAAIIYHAGTVASHTINPVWTTVS